MSRGPDREPLFLDTSVVMYAAGRAHPLRGPCRGALRHAVEEDVPLVTSAEVLQEILHRYYSLRRPEDAEAVFGATRDLCSEVLPVQEDDAVRALELLELLLPEAGITPRDAIHVAVMEHHELGRILSTDAHFDGIEVVERVDPSAWPG